MKKITAVYFSPCRHHKNSCLFCGSRIGRNGKRSGSTPLSAASIEISLDAEDVLLCGVPSFGGRVPLTALERIKNLHGNGAAAVAVVTYGNRAFDDTFAELQDALEAQGFVVVARQNCRCYTAFHCEPVWSRQTKCRRSDTASGIWQRNRRKADRNTETRGTAR